MNIHMYITLMFMQLAFKWFDKGMTDLEHESQVFIFNTRVLKVEPSVLDSAGYSCLRNFFETINLSERKLKRISGTLNLVGVVYWLLSFHYPTSYCVDCGESRIDWHRLFVEGEFFYYMCMSVAGKFSACTLLLLYGCMDRLHWRFETPKLQMS